MKRLQIFILLFTIALTLPLIFIVFKTYHGLAEEEKGELRYFSDRLFDNIENDLATFIEREEIRAVNEYQPEFFQKVKNKKDPIPSPLSEKPKEHYIIGYFQNNPDGSFQTPLISNNKESSRNQRSLYAQLNQINQVFNQKKIAIDKPLPPPPVSVKEKIKSVIPKKTGYFSDKYLKEPRRTKKRSYLGKKEKRTEEITASQALNMARQSSVPPSSALSESQMAGNSDMMQSQPFAAEKSDQDWAAFSEVEENQENLDAIPLIADIKFQVEVAPFQSVFIDSQKVFMFRRVVIKQQIYRQGFAIEIKPFLKHLSKTFFKSEPMSQFTRLSLKSLENGEQSQDTVEDEGEANVQFQVHRKFLPPFDFFSAALTCEKIPPSPHRHTLNIILFILGIVTVIGLLGIYQSARAVVELSERRSQFVSSVTHELKTPLTNIRMYAEMLDEGIAKKLHKEKEYVSVINTESVRLTRLITNVLELSKLEKKKRNIMLKDGDFNDVIEAAISIMSHPMEREGFHLVVQNQSKRPFRYDYELMVQVMVNLIENSIKFGNTSDEKEMTLSIEQPDGARTLITLSDKGPGIARNALKKVFNDFYREENELTRSTRGTGIGLSLVKRFVESMGGKVSAANNKGSGCTISIHL